MKPKVKPKKPDWREHLWADEIAVIERADALKKEWSVLSAMRSAIINRASQRARRAAGK